jgi:cytoskeletal protein CcmA (bactofilin family)
MANEARSFQFFDSTKATPNENGARSGATVIGPDVILKGNLKSGGDVVIAGTFEGDIACEGRLTIVAGATVVGSVGAAEVVLGGKINGNSVATKTLTLLSTAEVRGDVTTPQIVIEPGATFVGRCTMPQPAK